MSNLLLLGIDGLPPTAFDRFVHEGIMPNSAKLLAESARLDVVPTLPALTAPGWQTIASGAHPSTLGISGILLPTPGHAPDHVRNGFNRSLNGAEFLWESLVAEGHPAVVLKFPGSWPPSVEDKRLTQIDGAGGYADITCAFEEISSTCYSSGFEPPQAQADGCCAVPRGYEDHWRIDDPHSSGWTPVIARNPEGWANLPADAGGGFEVVLPLEHGHGQARSLLHARAYGTAKRPVLIVSRSKDGREAVATLTPGEWSQWIFGRSASGAYAYRLKLLELDLEGRVLRLYRSEGHRTSGFARPAHVAEELVRAIGPVPEWTGTFDIMNGLIDLDTQLEIYDRHTAWLEGAIEELAGRRSWRGFFVHWHVVEYAHHIAGAALDPSHPMHTRDQEHHLAFLRETYRLLDRLIGTVLGAIGPRDALALISDHGHDTVHSLFYLNDFLRARGWLAMTPEGQIDWSRTRAYGLFPGMILLNEAGRWPGGIVPDDERDTLCEEIAAALRGLVDPRTGRPVVTAVLGPAEMRAHGQGGATAPNLFFTMDKGYEPATRLRADQDSTPYLFELTVPGTELTSGHGSFHPTSPSARTLALLRHPDLAGGAISRHPVTVVDLAPTFAALMGVRAPSPCDGRALDLAALGLIKGDGSA